MQVTVILCFYNEEWFALLRSVWGVIMNSPEEIVDEILLVDDGSTMRHLGSLLDEYLEALPFLKASCVVGCKIIMRMSLFCFVTYIQIVDAHTITLVIGRLE